MPVSIDVFTWPPGHERKKRQSVPSGSKRHTRRDINKRDTRSDMRNNRDMAQTKKDIWTSPATIISNFDVDGDGTLNYTEFQTLCVHLFGKDEVTEHEWRVREIFELFDVDRNGTLSEQELSR